MSMFTSSPFHGVALGKVVAEHLDGATDALLDGDHARPELGVRAEPRDRPGNPLGDVGLDDELDGDILFCGYRSLPSSECHKLQRLLLGDERGVLVAYADTFLNELGGVSVSLKSDDAPLEQVMPPVPVESGEFMEPPQTVAQVPGFNVVRLGVLDGLDGASVGGSC